MGVSPRLGKREILQQRRSRVAAHDDTEAMKTKQRPIRAADALKVRTKTYVQIGRVAPTNLRN